MPVDAPQYPVNLVLAGRRCLVVGGGHVAARKAAGLRACGAHVHVVATRVGPEVRALDGVTWEERPYRTGEVAEGWRLAVAATDDAAVNAEVFRDGEAAGVWVNSADDPASSSFTLPSVVRRGPVMVAISTGGRSPALATWLKRQVEAWLGPEYEVLVDLLSDEREALRDAGRSTEGFDWQKALDSDMLELIRAGKVQEARERLQACLSSS
jgi:precorrin-2 dehydrogenase/sirohydrochlorin ferrochelatase